MSRKGAPISLRTPFVLVKWGVRILLSASRRDGNERHHHRRVGEVEAGNGFCCFRPTTQVTPIPTASPASASTP